MRKSGSSFLLRSGGRVFACLFLLGGMSGLKAHAQHESADTLCRDTFAISAEQALALAAKKGKGTPQPYAGPHARLVRLEGCCAWYVHLDTYRHTNRGDCKYTNGCTLVKTTRLWLDAETGRLIRRVKSKHLYPNYE